jgi:hypothetical protein
VVQFNAPPRDDFVTLTSNPEMTAPTVLFQAADTPTAEALQAQLADLGVLAITGPSEAGVFTATLAEDADAEAVAQAISERSGILFAAPEASQ